MADPTLRRPGGHTRRVLDAATARELIADKDGLNDDTSERRSLRRQFMKQLRAIGEKAERDGYAAGMTQALSHMAIAHERQQRLYRETESRLADIVTSALRKIVGDLPPELLARGILRNALGELQDSSAPVVLEVHPQMAEVVSEQLAEWQSAQHSFPPVEIREVDTGHLLRCRLDLGDSVLDASLLTQLNALENSIGVVAAESS